MGLQLWALVTLATVGMHGTTTLAAEPKKGSEKSPDLEAFMNHGDLVLVENGEITKFMTPKALAEFGRFQVRLKRKIEKSDTVATIDEPRPLADRIEARKIMHEANQAFFRGEVAETWALVSRAEQLDPTYYRIKTMKGSLLFKIGSKDLAGEVWRHSLQQNPDQPEIIEMLKLIDDGDGSKLRISTGQSRDNGKERM